MAPFEKRSGPDSGPFQVPCYFGGQWVLFLTGAEVWGLGFSGAIISMDRSGLLWGGVTGRMNLETIVP